MLEEKIVAVVLAGGKNSRIGREKALIELNGSLLLAQELEVLEKIFQHIMIVTSKPEVISNFKQYPKVSDQFKDCGPLAGIQAALDELKQDIFVFGCDMPFLNETIIRQQIERYKLGNFQALVPKHKEGIEPLHAIYSKTCLQAVQEQLTKGNYSVRSFFQQIKIEYLEFQPEEIKWFFNINTEADLEKVKRGKRRKDSLATD